MRKERKEMPNDAEIGEASAETVCLPSNSLVSKERRTLREACGGLERGE